MTRSEIALLLGAAAARDQRTVGEADVLAWHEDVGDLDFADAREAVSRHYRQSTDRIMPAHVRQLVRIIRDERQASAAIVALPPVLELPEAREVAAKNARNSARLRDLLTQLAEKRSIPADDTPPPTGAELIRQRAVDRARAERR